MLFFNTKKNIPYNEDAISRFFIAGCQRSGTTMLRLALSSHSHVICFDEPLAYKVLSGMPTTIPKRCSCVGFKVPRWTEQFISTRWSDIGLKEETNNNYRKEPIIFIVRNILDTITSMYSLKSSQSNWLNVWGKRIILGKRSENEFVLKYNEDLELIDSLNDNDEKLMAIAALYWKYKNDSLKTYINHGLPILPVSYEKLVRQPENELKRIVTFLKLKWSGKVLHHNRNNHQELDNTGMAIGNTDPKRSIDCKSLNKWQAVLTEYDRKLILSVAGDTQETVNKIIGLQGDDMGANLKY